jgi:hypothetical protein
VCVLAANPKPISTPVGRRGNSEEEQAPKKSTRRWDREQIREEESVLRRLRISHEMGSGAALVHVDSVAVFFNFNRDQNRSREKMLM